MVVRTRQQEIDVLTHLMQKVLLFTDDSEITRAFTLNGVTGITDLSSIGAIYQHILCTAARIVW